tara:strand:+ start:330 stop:956 length:627 start_codon:yes stop_codon:yes gene_type:complete
MNKSDISINQIKSALGQYRGNQKTSDFDLNKDSRPTSQQLLRAAVLLPLILRPSGLNVILTKRSNHLKNHPGQIALPGGKFDEGDRSFIDTALREAEEEIGLSQSIVNILGTLPDHETVTSFCVTPVVGLINTTFEPELDRNEVDEIFEVPLRMFTESKNFKVHNRIWNGIERHYFVVPYGPYYIWGATARILRMFCDVIGGQNEINR